MNADILFHIWCATFFDYAPQNFLELKEVLVALGKKQLTSLVKPIVCSAFSFLMQL